MNFQTATEKKNEEITIVTFNSLTIMFDCFLSIPTTINSISQSLPVIVQRFSNLSKVDLKRVDIILISNHLGIMGLPLVLKEMRKQKHKSKNPKIDPQNTKLFEKLYIFSTEPTKEYGRKFMQELVHYSMEKKTKKIKYSKNREIKNYDHQKYEEIYTMKEIAKTISLIKVVNINQIVCPFSGCGIEIIPFSSGFSIGSCNWLIRTKGNETGFMERLVYFSNSCSIIDRHPSILSKKNKFLDEKLYPNFFIEEEEEAQKKEEKETDFFRNFYKNISTDKVDIIIITNFFDSSSNLLVDDIEKRSYNILKQLEFEMEPNTLSPEIMLGNLTTTMESVCRNKGTCIVPCHSAGTVYDLVEFVSQQIKGIDTLEIYCISPIFKWSLSYSNVCCDWLCKDRKSRVFQGKPPFLFQELLLKNRLHIFESVDCKEFEDYFSMRRGNPSIFFVGHPSLRFGPVTKLLSFYGKSPKNALFLIEPDYSFKTVFEDQIKAGITHASMKNKEMNNNNPSIKEQENGNNLFYVDENMHLANLKLQIYEFPIDIRLNCAEILDVLEFYYRPKNLVIPRELEKKYKFSSILKGKDIHCNVRPFDFKDSEESQNDLNNDKMNKKAMKLQNLMKSIANKEKKEEKKYQFKIPLKRQFIRSRLSNDIAYKIFPKRIKRSNISVITGSIQAKNGFYYLAQTESSLKKFKSRKKKLTYWGNTDIKQMKTLLEKNGMEEIQVVKKAKQTIFTILSLKGDAKLRISSHQIKIETEEEESQRILRKIITDNFIVM